LERNEVRNRAGSDLNIILMTFPFMKFKKNMLRSFRVRNPGIVTIRRIFHPGISTSWTKNPPGEWLFRCEFLIHGLGIHLPRITSSGTRHLPEEWDSAGITSSFMLILTGKIKMRGKSSER
jgi:hypothetical protein